jgi:hypothetical protein
MMALRKSQRRGSAWVNHSISLRARESMLLARRPSSSNEWLAVYGALPAHGTDLDARF